MRFDGPGSVGSRAVDRAKAPLGRAGNDVVVHYRSLSTTVVAT
jgi:RND superfamily putative drug exporter